MDLEIVREFIAKHEPEGEFVVSEWAVVIRAAMLEQEPLLLQQWETELSTRQIASYLSDHLRHHRNSVARTIHRMKTDAAIDEAVQTGRLSPFLERVCIDAASRWKPVGKVNRHDAEYVSNMCTRRGNQQLLEAAFWREIGKKVGDQTVDAAMDEATFIKLYRSITGNPEFAAA